MNEVIVLLLKN